MQGKRTKKSIWTLSRLVPLALLLAAVILLPSISGALQAPPVAPPAVETPEPPVEELPVEEPPVVEELPEPEPEPEPYPNPDKPMIALTFDDGPGSYTDRLLDAFAQHGGKGTFFMVGRYISSFPDTVRRMAEEGHELGNHSWSHSDLTKLSAAKINDEIIKTRDKIREVTGVENTLVRLPYGSTNQKVRTVAGETGGTLVRWSVDPQDWKFRDADIVYNAVMSRVKDGSIVLVHDIHATTIDAMERLIPDLQAAGYQLVTVSELLEYRYEETAPQIVYPPEPEPEPEPAPEPPAPAPQTPAPQPTTDPTPAPQPAEPPPAPEQPDVQQTPAPAVPAEPETPAAPSAADPQTPVPPTDIPITP